MTSDRKFKMYACCHPVKGFQRSIIYDLQRNSFRFIPNILCEILQRDDGNKTVSEIKKQYNNEADRIIDEYFSFLIREEYIYFIDEPEVGRFPNIDLSFKWPGVISFATIVIGGSDCRNLTSTLDEISNLGCRDLQLIYSKNVPLSRITTDLTLLSESAFRSIELITPYDSSFLESETSALVNTFRRIAFWLIHSAPETKRTQEPYHGVQEVIYSNKIYDPYLMQTFENETSFNLNIKLFTEAHHHHTYYNGKICIDENGDIKNSLPNNKIYGNIYKSSLNEIILKAEIPLFWNVRKDETKICRDCEYRYMCMDNRLPAKNEDGTWGHETECLYNPYIAQWKGENSYKPLSETKEYLDMSDANPIQRLHA
jgi:SPASM domain peptide maturase of grasp-with-spasm system